MKWCFRLPGSWQLKILAKSFLILFKKNQETTIKLDKV
jgi:hypothetical protein